MAAIIVLSVSFATWRTLSNGFATWAWLQTFDPPGTSGVKGPRAATLQISPEIIEAATVRLGRTSSKGLDRNLKVFVIQPNLISLQRGTDDPKDDDAVVSAVAQSLVASQPKGTLRYMFRMRLGPFGTNLMGSSERIAISAFAGLLTLLILWITKRIFRAVANRRTHFCLVPLSAVEALK
jgi:hypothetical protein